MSKTETIDVKEEKSRTPSEIQADLDREYGNLGRFSYQEAYIKNQIENFLATINRLSIELNSVNAKLASEAAAEQKAALEKPALKDVSK
jgi:hypothetical protein